MLYLFLSLYYQVVSMTEYHRRIDALNSEDLRSLCKRLQVLRPALSARPLYNAASPATVPANTVSLRPQQRAQLCSRHC